MRQMRDSEGFKMNRLIEPLALFHRIEESACVWVNGPTTAYRPVWKRLWNGARFRYATDGAANSLQPLCREGTVRDPHVVAGDMDSITKEARSFFEQRCRVELTPNQDETDLTKTLRILHQEMINVQDKKSVRVVLLGGISGRYDHCLSAVNSIYTMSTLLKLPIYALDTENLVTVVFEGLTELKLERAPLTGICGFIPFCQRETRVTTSGFKWNVENQKMEFGGLISSSNELKDEKATIETTAPLIFTLELKTDTVCEDAEIKNGNPP